MFIVLGTYVKRVRGLACTSLCQKTGSESPYYNIMYTVQVENTKLYTYVYSAINAVQLHSLLCSY